MARIGEMIWPAWAEEDPSVRWDDQGEMDEDIDRFLDHESFDAHYAPEFEDVDA